MGICMANRTNSQKKIFFSSQAQNMGLAHRALSGTRDKNRQNFIIKTQTFAKVIFTETPRKCQK